ncbi:unnamed protein product, partial [Prorocentrum cordatum]
DYATEDGAQILLRFLEEQRFAKSSFRELPKVFDAFFDQTHFDKKGGEPMAAFCTAMEVARRNLEEVGPDKKIRANELGYHTLKRSGLDKDERNLVIARADETFNFQKISTTLKDSFPRGGGRHRDRQGSRTSWRWANYNDGERDPEDDDKNVEHDGYWVQDDDGYWYEWDEGHGDYAFAEDGDDSWDSSDMFYIEDDTDVYSASEDEECQQALVMLRESRLKMNKTRAARGFFKGRIDGVVDESAAAGGKAAGEGGKGGKGKDGGKGKSKDERPAGKGFKGRGETSKAQSRPRRLGFWAMTTLARVMPDMFHQKDAQDPELATEKFQEPAEHDIMMVNMQSDPILPEVPEVDAMISSTIVPATLVDSGASVAVAGRGWLGKIATELEKYGLRPIIVEASQKFKGAKQKWIGIPIGIGKRHVLQEYFEIPGDMIGLTRKKNLADWKTNLYLCEDGQWADFQVLGVYDKELVKLPGGHAGIDIFDCDLESYEEEPLFEKFRTNVEKVEPEVFPVAETLQVSKPDFRVKGDSDRWAQDATRNGNKGIWNMGTPKRFDKLMKEYAVIFDLLRDSNETFLWELFAKE